jgi:phosphoenolpyruvate synthase/pyruvate phosphate dikinase
MTTSTASARGINVVCRPTSAPITGTVKFILKPKDAVALVRSGDVSDIIVLSVGGAVTFVGTVLMKQPAALLTVEGAPESHLGILAREFDVPAIMSLELVGTSVPKFDANGLLSAAYEREIVAALDGKRVSLDITDQNVGLVTIHA